MPAIQLARLKIQAARLAERFADPAAFVRGLHDLLDAYADRAYRPGREGEPPPLLVSYNTPPPVLRQALVEVEPLAAQDRGAGLALCDALWQQPYYEFRLLAIQLLGKVEPEPEAELLERARAWAVPGTELRLLKALFLHGLARLRQASPERFLGLAQRWLVSEEAFNRHLGLLALQALLSEPEFENIPALFHAITPLVRAAPTPLRPDLQEVIELLARRSPGETAFFLRQNLAMEMDNPGTAWLTRHCLHAFPGEFQASLRAALRRPR